MATTASSSRFRNYVELIRLHRPIGIYLLLWPTWWALWLAAEGLPSIELFVIFTLGTIVMRSAGCVVNDLTDQEIDKKVARTKLRPLATGTVTRGEAKLLFSGLILIAVFLVLLTNTLTIYLSLIAFALACTYPWMKRYTHLPQVVLGAAFSMGIPMAFTATNNTFQPEVMLIFLTNLLWTVVYDTFYGMTDRKYDKHIGVKSTAILFEGNDQLITGSLQVLVLVGFLMIGQRFNLGLIYYAAVAVSAALMIYHQRLISKKETSAYFAAFTNNHWIGLVIFIGIAAHYALTPTTGS
jgi:4-hydroxybenzoate polyprenyltransferase